MVFFLNKDGMHYEKKVLWVIVNSSININKTNNCFSPQTFEHKKNHNMTLEIDVLAWNRQQNVALLI
jgi:hypothetical protein